MTMKHLVLLCLLLGACAGGPMTTDAELEWELAENSAEDQEHARAGDAKVLEIVALVQEGILALGRAVEAAGGAPLPPAVSAASDALAAYAAPGVAARPDPDARPEDGFDWAHALNLLLWGAGGGGLLSLLRRILPKDPLPVLADALTRRKHDGPPKT